MEFLKFSFVLYRIVLYLIVSFPFLSYRIVSYCIVSHICLLHSLSCHAAEMQIGNVPHGFINVLFLRFKIKVSLSMFTVLHVAWLPAVSLILMF